MKPAGLLFSVFSLIALVALAPAQWYDGVGPVGVVYDGEFPVAGGEAVWGGITGDLTNQVDLAAALNGKANSSLTLTINGDTKDLSTDRSWTVTAAPVAGTAYLSSNQTFTGQNTFTGPVSLSTNVNGMDFTAGEAIYVPGKGIIDLGFLTLSDDGGARPWKAQGTATNGEEIVNYQTLMAQLYARRNTTNTFTQLQTFNEGIVGPLTKEFVIGTADGSVARIGAVANGGYLNLGSDFAGRQFWLNTKDGAMYFNDTNDIATPNLVWERNANFKFYYPIWLDGDIRIWRTGTETIQIDDGAGTALSGGMSVLGDFTATAFRHSGSGLRVGTGATTGSGTSVAVGPSAAANQNQSTAVGNSATSAEAGVAIGHLASAGNRCVVIGNSASASAVSATSGAIAIGNSANGGSGTRSVVIGESATTSTFTNTVVLGRSSSAVASNTGTFGNRSIVPQTTKLYDLGSPALSWNNLYLYDNIVIPASFVNQYQTTATGADTAVTSRWQSFTAERSGDLSQIEFGVYGNATAFDAEVRLYSGLGTNGVLIDVYTLSAPGTLAGSSKADPINFVFETYPVTNRIAKGQIYTANIVRLDATGTANLAHNDPGGFSGGRSDISATGDYGYFSFQTQDNGWTLALDNGMIPSVSNRYDLGSAALPWRSLYVSTNTVYLGQYGLSVADGKLAVSVGTNAPVDYATEAFVTGQGYALASAIPTNVSQLANDSGFLTSIEWNQIGGTQTDVSLSGFNNDAGFLSSVDWSNIGGNQGDISLSGFNNDAGFITGLDWSQLGGNQSDVDLSGFSNNDGFVKSGDDPNLGSVNFGSTGYIGIPEGDTELLLSNSGNGVTISPDDPLYASSIVSRDGAGIDVNHSGDGSRLVIRQTGVAQDDSDHNLEFSVSGAAEIWLNAGGQSLRYDGDDIFLNDYLSIWMDPNSYVMGLSADNGGNSEITPEIWLQTSKGTLYWREKRLTESDSQHAIHFDVPMLGISDTNEVPAKIWQVQGNATQGKEIVNYQTMTNYIAGQGYAQASAIPTNVSQLANDVGYLADTRMTFGENVGQGDAVTIDAGGGDNALRVSGAGAGLAVGGSNWDIYLNGSMVIYGGAHELSFADDGALVRRTTGDSLIDIGNRILAQPAGEAVWKAVGTATNGDEIVNHQTMTNFVQSGDNDIVGSRILSNGEMVIYGGDDASGDGGSSIVFAIGAIDDDAQQAEGVWKMSIINSNLTIQVKSGGVWTNAVIFTRP